MINKGAESYINVREKQKLLRLDANDGRGAFNWSVFAFGVASHARALDSSATPSEDRVPSS